MIDAIVNFRRIDQRLLTSGQPTEAQFRALAAAGCVEVINLATDDPRWALPGEAELLLQLGMAYHHIPVVFSAPQAGEFARFERTLDTLRQHQTLVHCAANYRVSCFMALYGERRMGWTREQADAHIASVWSPDAVWSGFLSIVRAQDSTP